MILKILDAQDKRLRNKSKSVQKIDKKIKKLISDMKETLKVQDDPEGIGLAAPQVGKNLRIFLMKPDSEITVVINPKIINPIKTKKSKATRITKKKRKEKLKEGKVMEGCLSLPHYYGPIKREGSVKVTYLDEEGNKKTESFKGLKAQIVLHEIDHLNGILFVDRLLEQKKPLFEYVDGDWEEVEI